MLPRKWTINKWCWWWNNKENHMERSWFWFRFCDRFALRRHKSFPLNICITPVVIVDVSDSSCYVLGTFELRRYKGFPVNKQRKRRTWGWHMKMKNVVRFVVKEHEAAIWKWRSSFDFFGRPSAQWETHKCKKITKYDYVHHRFLSFPALWYSWRSERSVSNKSEHDL